MGSIQFTAAIDDSGLVTSLHKSYQKQTFGYRYVTHALPTSRLVVYDIIHI